MPSPHGSLTKTDDDHAVSAGHVLVQHICKRHGQTKRITGQSYVIDTPIKGYRPVGALNGAEVKIWALSELSLISSLKFWDQFFSPLTLFEQRLNCPSDIH
jgi:hypothetical protein